MRGDPRFDGRASGPKHGGDAEEIKDALHKLGASERSVVGKKTRIDRSPCHTLHRFVFKPNRVLGYPELVLFQQSDLFWSNLSCVTEKYKFRGNSPWRKLSIYWCLVQKSSSLFKNQIPEEAISKIKNLEKNHQITIDGFKIMAPAKLFKLENADDPLLFAPIGNNYYYLIHKWGNDLSPLRKSLMLPFKTLWNSVLTLLFLSFLTIFFLPISKFGPDNINVIKVISFLFIFKTYCAIFLYYSFWMGKNFSSEIWNSKYYN